MRLWEREARFFAELAHRIPARVPHCYYSGSDPEEGRYALLLEDLTHLTAGDQLTGATPAQARATVRWMARFHAAWWGSPELQRLDWVPTTAQMQQGTKASIEQSWPRFVDTFAAELPPKAVSWVEQIIPHFGEPRFTVDCPETLAHYDLRLDNVFFDEAGDALVIDWQAAAVSHGMYDVAYFVVGSSPTKQRRAMERELVSLYRDVLVDADVDPPSKKDLFDLYRQHLLWRLPLNVLTAQIDAGQTGLVKLMLESNRRVFMAAEDLHVGEFVPR
jgi:thiamine kinase-like enzyme